MYFNLKSHPFLKIIEDLPNKISDLKQKFWFVGSVWQSPIFDLNMLGY